MRPTRADGVAPVGEQVLRELPLQRTKHLVAADGQRVVGYLNLAPGTETAPPIAELVVAPDVRRRGVGASMVRAAIDAGGDATRIWAHGDLEPARAIAAALGLKPVRELWQMRRPLTDLPPATMPARCSGAHLPWAGRRRRAAAGQQRRVRVAPRAGRLDARRHRRAACEPWFDADGLFLAFDGQTHKLVGFHWTKVHVDHPGLGEVYVVGVDPGEQGRGLGRALTLVGLHHLAARLAG